MSVDKGKKKKKNAGWQDAHAVSTTTTTTALLPPPPPSAPHVSLKIAYLAKAWCFQKRYYLRGLCMLKCIEGNG